MTEKEARAKYRDPSTAARCPFPQDDGSFGTVGETKGRPGGRPFVSFSFELALRACYWFSRFQLMRSPSVVDEEDEELDWLFDLVSL